MDHSKFYLLNMVILHNYLESSEGSWGIISHYELGYYIPLPIGSMYAIYGNICHQYTPFMLAYIAYMDPMGYEFWLKNPTVLSH